MIDKVVWITFLHIYKGDEVMNIKHKTMSGVLSLALAAMPAMAQTVTWEQIPSALSANDMSPDGRFVVGEADQNNDSFPDGTYLWDRQTDTFTILPPPGLLANSVSDDGQVVLGNMPDPVDSTQVAGIWTEKTGWVSLGYLPDAGLCPSRSSGYELSADGSVAVGLSFFDGCQAAGFVWSQATGMLPLESMANGTNRASVVSADGSQIGGFAQGSFSRTPAIWDGITTLGTLLDPPDGDALGEIYGIRDDGLMLLGSWLEDEVAGRATKWTWSNSSWEREMIGAGSLSGTWKGIPMDIADNGTIVGFDFLVGNRRAWIQPNGTGPLVKLDDYVEAHGGKVPAGEAVQVCQTISTDGSVIVGHSWPMTAAWIVTIGQTSCPADLDGDGTVATGDLLALFAEWGPNPGSPADLDGDGTVSTNDMLTLFANWGPCE